MSNLIVAVTGATSGFGEAIARRFIQDGAKVIGLARRQEKLDRLGKELGAKFLGVPLDVQDKKAVQKAFSTLPKDFKNISVLVNNAGLALGIDPAQKSKLEDWEQMVQTNINGLLYCTHAVLPDMVERKEGHIINLGSVAGEFPYPGGNVYGGTKAFVHQFSLNLRADLLGTPIRVTNIEPGLCGGTEFSQVRFKGDESKAKKVYEGTNPLTSEDIAETVSWIVNLPKRVNINTISMMPVGQAFSPFAVDRK